MKSLAAVLLRLDELDAAPPLVIGGWSWPHVLEHCAQSIEYSITGYPMLRSGLFRATVGRLAKGKFLRAGAMRHDCEAAIPGAPALSASDGRVASKRLRRAISAFDNHQGPLAEHLAYGRCTKSEYDALHAMHVANHFTKTEKR